MAVILVVEDEPLVRDTIRLSLETGGYQVIIAADGREGIAMLRNNTVDVVVTDLIMPEQEGLETIRIIRRDYPQTKVIAISGGGRHVGTDYLKAASLLDRKSVVSGKSVSVRVAIGVSRVSKKKQNLID